VYNVLITAFQESCVPILGCLIGILCANARFNRIERKVLYGIAPQRMPILYTPVVGTQDTVVILCANYLIGSGFFRSARTKVVSFVPTAVYRSHSIAHSSKNVLAHRILICSAQDSKVESGAEHM
jgi:hypothetical protein